MRALLNINAVEKIDSKKLYKEVLEKFDHYNINQLTINRIAECSISRRQEVREECYQRRTTDKVLNAAIASDNLVNAIYEFETKISFVKTQFTDDEMTFYHYSIEERELDKEIMDRICKSPHKYYEIKKSCYLKIALALGLVKPKNSKSLQMIAQI